MCVWVEQPISSPKLLYGYEIAGILFFQYNPSSDKFNILHFTTGTTRSADIKLYPQTAISNYIINSYLYHLPRLWNSLPMIDASQSIDINLRNHF